MRLAQPTNMQHSIKKRMTTRLLLLATILWVSVALGCSSSSRIAVTGTVTLDDKPLEIGAISFCPAAGNPNCSAGGSIHDGQFELAAAHGLVAGKYVVTIQTYKKTGRMIKDPKLGKVAEQAMIEYNEASKLEANVTSSKNTFDFKLTSVRRNH